MTDARARRQRIIADLLRAEPIGSQEEVTERLSTQGFAVTQATVSRDLEQLGAVKVKRGGMLRYMLPDEMGDTGWAAARLGRILSEWVQSIETAGPLLVLRTPPGSAHIVGLALDQAKLPEIAGTICGDDTLFLALRDGIDPKTTAGRLRNLSREIQ
ncbi:MAG TPA: arginine repressor [Allosphingosinicella sp.]|nr:arginine repressor [Allosphingosinicella sp.]